MRVIILSLSFIAFLSTSSAQNFECFYNSSKYWGYPRELYICNVVKFPDILALNIKVANPNGTHISPNNNTNVESFIVENLPQKIHFFPHGLDEFFPNLQAIKIKSMGLKEIHQNDLKPFTDLQVLNLYGNNITYIERDLFKFNLKLTAISFEKNQIAFIDMLAFDDLKGLNKLYLGSKCIDGGANSHTDVASLIVSVEMKCSNVTQKMMLKEIGRDLRETKSEVESSLMKINEELERKEVKIAEVREEIEKIRKEVGDDGKMLKNEINLRENFEKFSTSNLTILSEKIDKCEAQNMKLFQEYSRHEGAATTKFDNIVKSVDSRVTQEALKLSSTQSEIKNALKSQNDEVKALRANMKAILQQTQSKNNDLQQQIAKLQEKMEKIEKLSAESKLREEVNNLRADFVSLVQDFENLRHSHQPQHTSDPQTSFNATLEAFKSTLRAELYSELLTNLKSELLDEILMNQTQPSYDKSDGTQLSDIFVSKHFMTYVAIPLICFVTILNVLVAVACFRKRMSLRVGDKKEKILLNTYEEMTAQQK